MNRVRRKEGERAVEREKERGREEEGVVRNRAGCRGRE